MSFLNDNILAFYKKITVFVMATLYIIIGAKHFTDPEFFINITPPFIQFKLEAVYFTGVLEILGGALILSNKTRKQGGYLLIFLLIIVFPANIYLCLSEIPRELIGITKAQALVRLPFQLLLIVIAYWHSQHKLKKSLSLFAAISFIPTIIYFASL
tara:strand:+ start:99 stop:566 length:468 start_codon:yes stop_codon:yes gene_type:complete